MMWRETIWFCTAHDRPLSNSPMLRPSEPAPALSGLRRVAKQALLAVGYYRQRLSQFDFPGVAVLCYHSVRDNDEDVPFNQLHVTRETFERHCKVIAETC